MYKKLGISSCRYLGEVDPENKRCHKDAVKLEKITAPCTAFVYDGVTCDENYLIVPSYYPRNIDIIKELVEFSTNVFLYYGHKDIQAWSKALENGNDFKEIPNMEKFVTEFPVAGLILKNIFYDYKIPQDFHIPGNFYVNLEAYVNAMKTAIPNLKIGLHVEALSIMFYSNNSMSTDWLDFNILNYVMDYFVIGFDKFNVCTEDLLIGGVVPYDLSDPSKNTLVKFQDALTKSAIAKNKVYFEFLINPTVKVEKEKEFIPCEISYNEYCENPEYKEIMCVDYQNDLFKKGQFAGIFSNGFIAKFIDLIDRDLKCECSGDKYIAFNMMLNGYTKQDILIFVREQLGFGKEVLSQVLSKREEEERERQLLFN
ncbi:uncharacterized protein LOC113560403 [Rhopalosiphum maidis]|uniref:uncharacterized protein LOC113560403 n=1 Tax=Rhopalosiphum maidis TaxID=43146 RepID=UPI000EFE3233|nr:uncharacterized protein LOC113560403 [Rhopalosiphum maidis]